MGCISANGYRLGQSITANGYRLGQSIEVSGYRLGQSIEVTGYKATPSVAASGFSRYAPLQVLGVAVCPLTTAPYIEITPQVIWLTESNGYSDYFDVESNTDWRILNE